MRTAIYLGLLAIADAINVDWLTRDSVIVYGCVLAGVIFLDINDFIKNR